MGIWYYKLIFLVFFSLKILVFFSFIYGVFNKKPCYLDKQQGKHEKTNKKVRQATGDKNQCEYNNYLLILRHIF